MSDPCPPCPIEDNSMFTILNVCRILFYTPIICLGGLISSVAYDYVTFKEKEKAREVLDIIKGERLFRK